MRARNLLLLPLLLVPAVATAGCSGTTDNSGGTTSIAGTTPATGTRSFAVETADGQASLSLDGQLPPGWPTAFPLPPGASPAGSGSLVRGESGSLVGVFKISGSPSDAFAFYTDNQDLQVTDKSSMGAGEAFVGRAKFSGPYRGSVTVGGTGGRDVLVVVLHPSSAATTVPPGGTGTTTAAATPGTTGT